MCFQDPKYDDDFHVNWSDDGEIVRVNMMPKLLRVYEETVSEMTVFSISVHHL